MTFSDVYKLACTQDPTIAVAAAAAEVGLPKIASKGRIIGRILPKRYAPKQLPAVSPRGVEIAEQSQAALKSMPPAKAAQPGLGSRIAKNWWTLPVAGAGLYGLGSFAKDMGSMAGGEQAAGYGQPSQMMPGAERYQQMMNMAHGHGY